MEFIYTQNEGEIMAWVASFSLSGISNDSKEKVGCNYIYHHCTWANLATAG